MYAAFIENVINIRNNTERMDKINLEYLTLIFSFNVSYMLLFWVNRPFPCRLFYNR